MRKLFSYTKYQTKMFFLRVSFLYITPLYVDVFSQKLARIFMKNDSACLQDTLLTTFLAFRF